METLDYKDLTEEQKQSRKLFLDTLHEKVEKTFMKHGMILERAHRTGSFVTYSHRPTKESKELKEAEAEELKDLKNSKASEESTQMSERSRREIEEFMKWGYTKEEAIAKLNEIL